MFCLCPRGSELDDATGGEPRIPVATSEMRPSQAAQSNNIPSTGAHLISNEEESFGVVTKSLALCIVELANVVMGELLPMVQVNIGLTRTVMGTTSAALFGISSFLTTGQYLISDLPLFLDGGYL